MKQDGQLLHTKINELVIASTKVAHVQLGNSLEHALLVLTKTGYSAVPVLDHSYRLHGQISTTMIVNKILGLERFEYEKLSEHTVDEVMNTKVPRMKESDAFLKALEMSINHPFICIEDENGIFQGILTRRSILAVLYRHFRNLPYPAAENQSTDRT
ncbi:cyclic-di-AMP-binding protein CbpB [Brevibacillus thermoruber]|uniref:CBS domain-containing protein n=1 Tax=Brevibacillus thermoruber TaxID=33942 RepID=A0A9X3Z261_9BACL|nr:cyclic-di-AMP-binding protein CbpB [Brevibacillus thermoruber]MDA5107284.1 CBS domain-containing protein [Brevibacillus thermoruber]